MSQAEALLASLGETVPEHVHPVVDDDSYFVIDPNTRIISNLSGNKLTVMQYDHNSEECTFELPRVVEGHDMMLCNSIVVHWNNIDGQTGQEIAESSDIYDLQINPKDSSTVICSWSIPRNSTQLAGNLSFLIQYKCVTNDGTVTYEWHSDIYSDGEVKPGRNNGEQSVIDYTDILEQWRVKVFGAGDSVISDIVAVSEEQKESIEAKGAETLATIPADYTTTYSMANNALRTRANAIDVTAEGEAAVADDCSDDYLRGLHVYGRTTQITTTGKQLAWPNINIAGRPYVGVVHSVTNDGNILIHGTSTDNMWNRLASANLVAGETYTLSSNKKISLSVWDVVADNAFATKAVNKESVTFIAPNTGSYAICIDNLTNTPFAYIRADIMLNEGNIPYPWEPYSNGLVSPCPEFPQELVSVTDPLIGLYGKNLIDVDEMELASNKNLTISPDKYTITVVGGSNKTYAYSHYDMPEELVRLVRGRTLRLSSDSISKSVSAAYSPVQLNIKCADGTFQYPVNHETRLSYAFYVPEDTEEIRFGIYTNNSASLLTSDNTVVVTGVRLTLADYPEYELYKGFQTIALSRTLSAIPVTSSGNYTDSNGQQWIADEIDFERGVYIQRIREVTIDGTQAVDTDGADHNPWRKYIWINAYPALAEHGGLCDKLKHRRSADLIAGNAFEDAGFNMSVNHNVIYFNIGHWMTEDTVAAAIATLTEHPLTIKYALKNPIETPLTDEELFAFSQLHSNHLVTTALNSENAHMNLVYNADTKTYFTNSRASDEQVLAAVDTWLTKHFTNAEGVSF